MLYLLDENVDPLFRKGLLQREPTMIVWRVGDIGAPPLGMLDPDILRWCDEHGFILITNNRESMPGHLEAHLREGRHIPGIIELNKSMRVSETIEYLWLIWAVGQEDEFRDRVAYLPGI